MSKLERYAGMFAGLRTAKNHARWSALTCHRAPHKPFLLLSIMDLIAEGVIRDHVIEPAFDLVDTFNQYWAAVMPPGARTSMAYPFPRLKSDGFWEPVVNPGYEYDKDYNVSSVARLRQVYAGARLDPDLFLLMADPQTREELRRVLIETYFAPEVRPLVLEQGSVNIAAYMYSKTLISEAREGQADWKRQEDSEGGSRVRDQGFRKAIVTLYDHRCALCGIRILTPDGHTVVEAGHIRPWRESRDDRPTNGLALCRLCHWSFDEGLMGVGQNYEVLVSRRVRTDRNLPGHMLSLSDRRIFRPPEEVLWPWQENLSWHRRRVFRA